MTSEAPQFRTKIYCPECAVGKTAICAEKALDPVTDEIVECSTVIKNRFKKETK